METQCIAYDICRYYISDLKASMSPDLWTKVDGLHRSRSLSGLADCPSLFMELSHTMEDLRALRQISAFFKKNADFSEDVKCRETALTSFVQAEKICRITNRRLDYYSTHLDRLDPDMCASISKMQTFISKVLGSYDRFFEDIPRLVRITAGATSTSGRRNSLPYMKLGRNVVTTERAKPYAVALARYFGYQNQSVKTISSSRIELVPKNFKTHRTIACEPGGNIPFQLAFDGHVKNMLRRKTPCDLSCQSKNQELAKQGSIDGSFATLDLSAASDTVAYSAVEFLFPSDWFQYLTDVRTSFGRLDGKLIKFAKFSSMGNGSTFPIETLIFAAACHATGCKDYVVYGDDIVVPTECYAPVCKILQFLGFSVNHEKSFSSGPFRESCGEDYFEGTLITPFYLRCWPKSRNGVSHNINGLVSVAVPCGRLWHFCRNIVRDQSLPLVPYGPDSMVGVFIDAFTCYKTKSFNSKPNKRLTPFQGIWYKGYVSKSNARRIYDSRTCFLWHLLKSQKPWSTIETSSVPTLSHKFVRKWVRWIPAEGVPLHVSTWSDYLTSRHNG